MKEVRLPVYFDGTVTDLLSNGKPQGALNRHESHVTRKAVTLSINKIWQLHYNFTILRKLWSLLKLCYIDCSYVAILLDNYQFTSYQGWPRPRNASRWAAQLIVQIVLQLISSFKFQLRFKAIYTRSEYIIVWQKHKFDCLGLGLGLWLWLWIASGLWLSLGLGLGFM